MDIGILCASDIIVDATDIIGQINEIFEFFPAPDFTGQAAYVNFNIGKRFGFLEEFDPGLDLQDLQGFHELLLQVRIFRHGQLGRVVTHILFKGPGSL